MVIGVVVDMVFIKVKILSSANSDVFVFKIDVDFVFLVYVSIFLAERIIVLLIVQGS